MNKRIFELKRIVSSSLLGLMVWQVPGVSLAANVSGQAFFDVDTGVTVQKAGVAVEMTDATVDQWLRNNEPMVWDVGNIANADHYKVLVNSNGVEDSYSATLSGNKVSFSLESSGHHYSTNEDVDISLQACDSNNSCAVVSSPNNLTLVNTNNLPYFVGKPKHINQFSAEMPYKAEVQANVGDISKFLENKRWNFSTDAKVTYDLDLKDVFLSYLYQYDLSGYYRNVNVPLFDGFSFTNQRFKVFSNDWQDECNEMQETFSTGTIRQLKGDLTECVRNYFDVVFGSKNNEDLSDREYFSNEKKPFLEVLHEAASHHSRKVGFYLVIPSGLVDQATTTQRRKLFIDEAIEQYAIFRANNPHSNVLLAGFYQMKESSSLDPVDLAVNNAVQAHIKAYSNELEYNSSSYNVLAGFKGPAPFAEHCQNNPYFQHCTSRFTAVHHKAFAEAFDDVSIQPNATMFRFHNRRHSYDGPKGRVADPNHTIGVDIEMLHWMNEGLFTPLAQGLNSSPADTEFSLHFEYSPHRVNGSNKHNYNFNSLSNGDPVGDISKYADYIMSELPDVYKNGSRPILYDDAGGLLYCHIKHTVGGSSQPSSRKCRTHATAGAIVGSRSDLQSMYGFVNAVRNPWVQYKGNNNILPAEPLLKVDTSRTTTIQITDTSKRWLTFQALVRARLNNATLHGDAASSTCSKTPEVTFNFYNNSGHRLTTSRIGASYIQTNVQGNVTNAMRCNNFKKVSIDADVALSGKSNASKVLDEDQWSVLKREGIYVPPHTARFSVSFGGVGNDDTVESLLFLRSEYKLH